MTKFIHDYHALACNDLKANIWFKEEHFHM